MGNGWNKDEATQAVTRQTLLPTGEGTENASDRSS